jgi:hypothetical protein
MAWLHSNRSIARPTKVKGRTLFGLGLLCGEIGKSEPRPEYANDQPDGENRTGRRTSPQSPFLPRRVTAATDVRLRDRGVYILAGIIEPAPARESRPGSQPPFDAIERGGHSRRTYRKNADAKRRAPSVLDLTALLPCRNLHSLPPSRRDPFAPTRRRDPPRINVTPAMNSADRERRDREEQPTPPLLPCRGQREDDLRPAYIPLNSARR